MSAAPSLPEAPAAQDAQDPPPAAVPAGAQGPQSAAPGHAGPLGLLEALDRGGAMVARVPITHWPLRVGRSLGADLVLDDPHVAAQHLQVEREGNGAVMVRVLDTINGVALNRRTHQRGEQFTWPDGAELQIGRLHLRLRLAEQSIAPEQPLPQFPWRTLAWTFGTTGTLLLMSIALAWLQSSDGQKFVQELPPQLAGLIAALGAWAGAWALVTKLFIGRQQFWRHVRIASATMVAMQCLSGAMNLLAFMFSWEALARFDSLITVPVLAAGVFMHLTVIAPNRRRIIMATVAAAVVLGVPALLGTFWLQNKRLSSQLYMASLFPPSWRIAPTVPVAQFVGETAALRPLLEQRVKDKEQEDAESGDNEE